MKFDVALSVASEQNAMARDLATRLERAGYATYFYESLEADGWGWHLEPLIDEVYERESRYCIVLVSAEYAAKAYTMYELRAALRRAGRQVEAYLLPVRLDETLLDEIDPGIIYLDMRRSVDIGRVFDRARQKLGPPVSGRTASPVVAQPDGVGYVVLQQGTRMRPVVNVACHVRNDGPRPATVQRLAARLTDPEGLSIPLHWTVFYRGEPVQMPTGEPGPFTLEAGQTVTLGIQFAAPESVKEYAWMRGVYDFDVNGWVTVPQNPKQPDLQTTSSLDLSGANFDWVLMWQAASDEQWRKLNDPHNAVGIPAIISPRR